MSEPRAAPDRRPLTRRELVFLAAWTVLAGAAYLYQIDARSLWLDEVMSINVAGRSWSGMWEFFQALPEQHPVYYLLLGEWIQLGTDEFTVRSLSAVFAVAGGWLSYLLARRLFGVRVAVLTATILLLSPFWLYYAQEARMYSLLGLLALASHLLYLRWRDGDGRAAWVYVLVGVFGAYTHLFFLFVPCAHLVVAVEKHRGLSPAVLRQGAAVAAIGLAYLPWAWLILTHMPEGQSWKGAKHLIFGLPYLLFRFSAGYSEVTPVAGWKQDVAGLVTEHGLVMAGVLVTFGAILLIGSVVAWRRGESGRFLVLSGVVPVLAMYALSTVTVMVGERYQVVIFPLFVILLAVAVESSVFQGRGKQALVGGVLAAAALAFSVNSLVGHYTNDIFAKADWRKTARLVAGAAEEGDRILFHPNIDAPFRCYYEREDAPPLEYLSMSGTPPSVDEDPARLWVIVSRTPEGSECMETLESRRKVEDQGLVLHRHFPSGAGIDVFLLEVTGAPSSGAGLDFAEVVRRCSG